MTAADDRRPVVDEPRCWCRSVLIAEPGEPLVCLAGHLQHVGASGMVAGWCPPGSIINPDADPIPKIDLPNFGVRRSGIEWPTYTYQLVWERSKARVWQRWQVAMYEVAHYSDGRTERAISIHLGRFWTRRGAYERFVDFRYVVRLLGGKCES